jgi:predicted SprT family Zn-dependent metalloprotease
MTDAEYEAQCKRIRRLMERWKDPLGLHAWNIEQTYHRGQIPPKIGGQTFEESLACTGVKWQYLYAHIEWDCEQAARCDDAWMETAVIHEYCHVLVAEMRHEDRDLLHEERVCTSVTLAIQWVRRMGQNETKEAQAKEARRAQRQQRAGVPHALQPVEATRGAAGRRA